MVRGDSSVVDMVQPIRRGLTRQLREALRSVQGYRVRCPDAAESPTRATLEVVSPEGRPFQWVEITGGRVRAQWGDNRACPLRIMWDLSLELSYEYDDPDFTIKLRQDTRDAARMHRALHRRLADGDNPGVVGGAGGDGPAGQPGA